MTGLHLDRFAVDPERRRTTCQKILRPVPAETAARPHKYVRAVGGDPDRYATGFASLAAGGRESNFPLTGCRGDDFRR
jgi:hypothetical protein